LVAFIAEKLAEREGFYEQATHIVDGITMTPDSLAELVNS
jgi:shikimate kinase